MIAADPRPMSSAPLDGTPVRLFVFAGSVIAAFWSEERCRETFGAGRLRQVWNRDCVSDAGASLALKAHGGQESLASLTRRRRGAGPVRAFSTNLRVASLAGNAVASDLTSNVADLRGLTVDELNERLSPFIHSQRGATAELAHASSRAWWAATWPWQAKRARDRSLRCAYRSGSKNRQPSESGQPGPSRCAILAQGGKAREGRPPTPESEKHRLPL